MQAELACAFPVKEKIFQDAILNKNCFLTTDTLFVISIMTKAFLVARVINECKERRHYLLANLVREYIGFFPVNILPGKQVGSNSFVKKHSQRASIHDNRVFSC